MGKGCTQPGLPRFCQAARRTASLQEHRVEDEPHLPHKLTAPHQRINQTLTTIRSFLCQEAADFVRCGNPSDQVEMDSPDKIRIAAEGSARPHRGLLHQRVDRGGQRRRHGQRRLLFTPPPLARHHRRQQAGSHREPSKQSRHQPAPLSLARSNDPPHSPQKHTKTTLKRSTQHTRPANRRPPRQARPHKASAGAATNSLTLWVALPTATTSGTPSPLTSPTATASTAVPPASSTCRRHPAGSCGGCPATRL